jgi:hypothetical protein
MKHKIFPFIIHFFLIVWLSNMSKLTNFITIFILVLSFVYIIWINHAIFSKINLHKSINETKHHCWFCKEIDRLSTIVLLPSVIIWSLIYFVLVKIKLVKRDI